METSKDKLKALNNFNCPPPPRPNSPHGHPEDSLASKATWLSAVSPCILRQG